MIASTDAQTMETDVLASWPSDASSYCVEQPGGCSQSWSTEAQSSSMLMTGLVVVVVPRVDDGALLDQPVSPLGVG